MKLYTLVGLLIKGSESVCKLLNIDQNSELVHFIYKTRSLYTLVGLLIKGSKCVHFSNEIVYTGWFTDERVEVCTLY